MSLHLLIIADLNRANGICAYPQAMDAIKSIAEGYEFKSCFAVVIATKLSIPEVATQIIPYFDKFDKLLIVPFEG